MSNQNRPLPQNIDAERALLGILLARNDQLYEVVGLLTKADFIEHWHGELFTLLRDMIDTGREAKPATVLHDLAQDADIGGITAAQYLETLLRDAPDAGMAKTFARTIRDLAARRRLLEVISQHEEEIYSAPATISATEIEARYHAAMSGLFTTVQEAGLKPLGDIGMELLKDTQAAIRGERRVGLSTGIVPLDDLMGPLLGGRLYVISGASGSGKTSMAWQIARHISDNGQTVLFESLEMDGSELATRDFTYLTGVPSASIERADLNVAQFEAMIEAQEKFQKPSRMIVDSRKGVTVGGIRGQAMRLKRMQGLGAIVIDHLRYIKATGRPKDIFDQQVADLQALNAVGDDLDVPVILLVQLKASYGAEIADWKKIREPNVGDIFNGAAIEQECDVLLLIHRMEYMLSRRRPPDAARIAEWAEALRACKGQAKAILNKRRGGEGYGSRLIGFDGPTTRFLDKPKEIDFFADVDDVAA